MSMSSGVFVFEFVGELVIIFMYYVLIDLFVGFKGLVIIGILVVVLFILNFGLNLMFSVLI